MENLKVLLSSITRAMTYAPRFDGAFAHAPKICAEMNSQAESVSFLDSDSRELMGKVMILIGAPGRGRGLRLAPAVEIL